MLNKEKIGFKSGTEKLICDLNEKRNYVIHYQNLKYVLSLGW